MAERPAPTCFLCDRPMECGHFLCAVHWDRLSSEARERVRSAMKSLGKGATVEDVRALFKAQDAALEELVEEVSQ